MRVGETLQIFILLINQWLIIFFSPLCLALRDLNLSNNRFSELPKGEFLAVEIQGKLLYFQPYSWNLRWLWIHSSLHIFSTLQKVVFYYAKYFPTIKNGGGGSLSLYWVYLLSLKANMSVVLLLITYYFVIAMTGHL